ncbi:MAG: hypothetical protein ACE5IO_04710 [Thermoplasmata archaeon]
MSGRTKEPLVVEPSLNDLTSGKVKNPDVITITTSTFGGIGDEKIQKYTTEWRPHYSGASKGEVHFDYGEFDTGQRVSMMMPWQVPQRHWVAANKAGGIIFDRKRYKLARLYGSRSRDSGDMLHLATARDESGEEYQELFAHSEDATLWALLSGLIGGEKLTIDSVQEVSPRFARQMYYPSEVPVKVIDMARENGLRQRYILYLLLEDIERGDTARILVQRIDPADREKWVKRAWESIAGDEDAPPEV